MYLYIYTHAMTHLTFIYNRFFIHRHTHICVYVYIYTYMSRSKIFPQPPLGPPVPIQACQSGEKGRCVSAAPIMHYYMWPGLAVDFPKPIGCCRRIPSGYVKIAMEHGHRNS